MNLFIFYTEAPSIFNFLIKKRNLQKNEDCVSKKKLG